MHVVSVNVGKPRPVPWRGRTTLSAIFKEPVTGRVAVRRLNLDGDTQADLSVHGGPDKAVYAYPSEHYPWWHEQLPGAELPWAAFGENLTTAGLVETEVRIGDEYRVGTARLVATQPRLPCFKLGIRFGDQRMVKRFRLSGRPGIYFAVAGEGDLAAGDAIELVRTDEAAPTVTDVFRLIVDDRENVDELRRALRAPALAAVWRTEFAEWLANLGADLG
ncbi:MAG TPA: MOSC domain-containing protein [Gemmataceae bacterium]|jgi:MOSC domain-containing protein YiiM